MVKELIEYCQTTYGTKLYGKPHEINIFVLEGCSPGFVPNNDAADGWNDWLMCISYKDGQPFICHSSVCTSEPGLSATHSKRAIKTGGVFRIAIGFHERCWKIGFHKGNRNHPALVQAAPIRGYRDTNKDGKRTGDPYVQDVKGLNFHSTRPNLLPVRVGDFSFGCIVNREWLDHKLFMRQIEKEAEIRGGKALFSATVVDFSKFYKWTKSQSQK